VWLGDWPDSKAVDPLSADGMLILGLAVAILSSPLLGIQRQGSIPADIVDEMSVVFCRKYKDAASWGRVVQSD
jgi:hypothetical protein